MLSKCLLALAACGAGTVILIALFAATHWVQSCFGVPRENRTGARRRSWRIIMWAGCLCALFFTALGVTGLLQAAHDNQGPISYCIACYLTMGGGLTVYLTARQIARFNKTDV